MKQKDLFDKKNSFELANSEWTNMPEFVQEKKEPYAKIIFRFDSEDQLQEFAALINQKLTKKTKSSWYPFKSHRNKNEL